MSEIPWRVAEEPWNARWGNHRARVRVEKKRSVVWTRLPWRRRDAHPEKKAVWVIREGTEDRINNVVCLKVDREEGEIAFEAPEPGVYDIYYMPFRVDGRCFPTTVYDVPEEIADPKWIKRHKLDQFAGGASDVPPFPQTEVVVFEARTEFDRMDPMELVAATAEIETLLRDHPSQPFLLFPEDRLHPIRMTRDIPHRWVKCGPGDAFKGSPHRNEFFVFQIGVWAARQNLKELAVSFQDLQSKTGENSIAKESFRCFNLSGRDWLGRELTKVVDVPMGSVQSLWIGVDVPEEVRPGVYEGTLTVGVQGTKPSEVRIKLDVQKEVLADRGDNELWRHSRLRWLDSKIGLEDTVTAPYTPLDREERTLFCLGRTVTFGTSLLPESILVSGENILESPMRFKVLSKGETLAWQEGGFEVVEEGAASVVMQSSAQCGAAQLSSRVKMEFDGYVNVQLVLKAMDDLDIEDCSLEIPLREEVATYMMGMGCRGGYRPGRWDWKWDQENHQDSLWIGDVQGGIQCKLKGPDYRWPLVNIHYHRRPLHLPEAWHNQGKGGCTVETRDEAVLIRATGGPRTLNAGEKLEFHFGLLITPVKPLDLKAHCQQRYFHSGVPSPDTVVERGAKIINIHHANEINPFINYPFLTVDALSAYVRDAHEHGLKVKLYYTIRELTNHVKEIWALRSLGDEIYADGPGGGYAWLHEHLVRGYSPAWHHPFPDGRWCSSISQTGLSRWHNYYIEGLGWLTKNVGIDGLYLDEIGYDREIMKRVRRVLDTNRPGSLLDLHSWNHFNDRAGHANCLNLYMEHLPYIDSLWIGEGRNYDEGPDHWMVEVSGIPFGLFSEMLQNGGNPWRGMLYAMTNRMPWCGNPAPIWELWDAFGLGESEMLGYWDSACPVRTGRDDVLCTVYRGEGRSLLCLASWAKEEVGCELEVDWEALGLDQDGCTLRAPAIQELQEEALLDVKKPLSVEPGKGWMLVVAQNENGGERGEQLRLGLWDLVWMKRVKKSLDAGEERFLPAYKRLLEDAKKALGEGPFSVTFNEVTPPEGTKNDYISMGPYWWPDPEKEDGLPYIRRDGEVNPERREGDCTQYSRMQNAVRILSLAWFFSGEEPYAEKAAELLKVWFLASETRMNPHLKYGQAIPGRCKGRYIGIIDMRTLADLVDAIALLETSGVLSEEERVGIRDWFQEYFHWLTESQFGKDEEKHPNNHSVAYDVQSCGIAYFLGDLAFVEKKMEEMHSRRIQPMIKEDGGQPQELKRTKAFGYSVGNLRNFLDAYQIGRNVDIGLSDFDPPQGQSLRKALDFLISYIGREEDWPYEQISGWEGTEKSLGLLIRRAAVLYESEAYQSLWGETFRERMKDHWALLVVPGAENL